MDEPGTPHTDLDVGETREAPPTPSPVPVPYASLGDRLIAQLVDGAVAFGVFFLVGMAVAVRFGGTTTSGFELTGPPAALVMVVVTLILFAYFTLAETMGGATLGKLVAGIRVRSIDGLRPTLSASVKRNLLRIVDGIGVYLIGAISLLISKRNQRLGDLVARTVVVRSTTPRPLKLAALGAALIIAVAGIVGGLGLRGTAAGGAPRFASVILTDSETGTVPMDSFAPSTPVFYAHFTLADVPDNSTLRAVWTAENVAGVAPETKVDENRLLAGGALNRGDFSLVRSNSAWPPGTYRLDLYIDERLDQTTRFAVTSPPTALSTTSAASTPVRTVSPVPSVAASSATSAANSPTAVRAVSPAPAANATAAASGAGGRFAFVTLTDEETGTVEKATFASSTRVFYARFALADVPPNTTLRAVWTAENVAGQTPETRVDQTELRAGGLQSAGTFSLKRDAGEWPPGVYRVDLYIGDRLDRTVRFAVAAAP